MAKIKNLILTSAKPFACGLKWANPTQNKIFYTVKPPELPTPYPWKHVHDDCIFRAYFQSPEKCSRREHAFTGKGLSQKWQ